jgi:prephenate dehydratase/prephenate dehydrogenase/ferredoxin-fold anticodon binding domain-containing protein
VPNSAPDEISAAQPRRLVVVGAAAGIAKWFGEHVLRNCSWDAITLLDAAESVRTIESGYPEPTLRGQVTGSFNDLPPDIQRAIAAPQTAIVLGVPIDTLAGVAAWLLPHLHESSVVIDLSHDRLRADEVLRAAAPQITRIGVHALVGISAPSAEGQGFVVCPAGDLTAHGWVSNAIERSGGTVNVLSAERHDEIMRYVQTASHQALLTFVDVLHQSGLDLERDLWANRTPVFEVLLSLASRVLTPGQDATTASIQYADSSSAIAQAFETASAKLETAKQVRRNKQGELTNHLADLRAPFPGSLFTKIQQVGAIATSAVQATRTEISRQRRADGLVGVVSLSGNDKLHVGHIETMTPTSFVLREILVGQPGRAALLVDDAAIANARKLGIGGKPKNIEFTLGRVRVLSNDELERALTEWLPTVARGVKLLVPESISGRSAVRVVESTSGVATAELVSEEVRLGQREIVVRMHARSDRNLDDLERAISDRVDDVFVWPDGVVLPITSATKSAVGFLGPAGTFSDTAARQLTRLLPGTDATRVEFGEFPQILASVADGTIGLGVVPIANSSSGLVDLAAGALLSSDASLTAGGVVDVLVRFDAYVAPGTTFTPGMTVYTHPQVIRQCSSFLAANSLVPVECSSTAEACRRVAEQGHGLAIANVGLQNEVGLDLARASVGNLAGAVTRFLVIGRTGAFAASPRVDATLRSVWLVEDPHELPIPHGSRFDELLHGPSGRLLLISTDPNRLSIRPGVRALGTFPWSPRTPVVVVS